MRSTHSLGMVLLIVLVIIPLKLSYVSFGRACHNDAACPHNPKIITVGVSLALTGPYASVGKSMKRGFNLWASEVNKGESIMGNKIDIKFEDNSSNPAVFTRNMETFMKKDVDIVFGPFLRPFLAKLRPLVKKYEYPMIVPAITSVKMQRETEYFAMLLSPMEEYMKGALEIAEKIQVKKLALLFDKASPSELKIGLEILIKEKKLNLIQAVSFEGKDRDFSAKIGSLKRKGVEAVFFINLMPYQSIDFTRQLKTIMPNIKMVLVTNTGKNDMFIKSLGKFAEGVYKPAVWHKNLATPRNKEFVISYKSSYNGLPPNQYVARAFAVGEICEEALKGVLSSKYKYFRNAVRKLKTSTILGKYEIASDGVQKGQKYLLIQWQDSKEKIVWPSELATAEPKKF